jgi:hypothetical protein
LGCFNGKNLNNKIKRHTFATFFPNEKTLGKDKDSIAEAQTQRH